jgi:hypothetical protein
MTETDTGPQEEPRWAFGRMGLPYKMRFLGRAGPLDIWLDPNYPSVPFLTMVADGDGRWGLSLERLIEQSKDRGIHLTLHDTCMIHTLCAPHNPTQPKETYYD